jgi:hypothetical protein
VGISAEAGVGPVTLSDLADWEGRFLPSSVKAEWLDRITSAEGQTARVGVGVTPIAFTAGPVGFQVAARAGSTANLSADAAELLLYGNAGRTGTSRDFALSGSGVDGFALTTGALSLGFRAGASLYLGVTGKYVIGNGLAVGRDAGSVLSGDPVQVDVDFPVLFSYADDYEFDNGNGIGFDLGAIWTGPVVTVGVVMENVYDSFEWNLDGFSYVAGQALFNEDQRDSDFDEIPIDEAPADVRADFEALAEEYGLERRIAVGATMATVGGLTLHGDVQKSLSDGMSFDPDFYAGVGAEWAALSFLPLRAHAAVISEGFQVGGGLSLVLGPVRLSGGGALRAREGENASLAMFTLSFGSH